MSLDERILRALGQAVIDHITAQAVAPIQKELAEVKAQLAEFTNGVEKPKRRAKATA